MKPGLTNGPIYPTTCSSQPDSTPISYPTTSSCLCSHCHHPPSCQTHNLEPSHPTSNPSTSLAWSTFKRYFKFTTSCYLPCKPPSTRTGTSVNSLHLSLGFYPIPSAVHSPPAARARPLKLGRSLPWLFKSPVLTTACEAPAGSAACRLQPISCCSKILPGFLPDTFSSLRLLESSKHQGLCTCCSLSL